MALPAYLSSSYASKATVSAIVPSWIHIDQDQFYTLGCTQWLNKLGRNCIPDNPLFQANWDKPLYIQRHQELLNSAVSEVGRARILSVLLDHASDWLYATPIASLGLKLSDSHLSDLVTLDRLQLNVEF